MTLIGIGGRLAAGKDAVADHLVREHGYVKMGMSDVLLEVALTLDPIVYKNFADPIEPMIRFSDVVASLGYTEAKKLKEVRRFLQVLGTEVGRDMIGENVWVDMMERRITNDFSAAFRRNEHLNIIVTGIRFPNELEMIQRIGGGTWWVSRPQLQTGDAHASERGVELADFQTHIRNDGDLDALYAEVDRVVPYRKDAA